MVRTGRIRSIVLAVLVCAVAGACGETPSESSPATTGTPTRPADQAKGEGVPPDMVSAVSASRASLIIGVHFALRETPAVGKPLPVDVAIVPHQSFLSVGAKFDGQEGLAVTSGAEMPAQRGVKAEQVLKHRLELRPDRDGLYMVTASVATEADEGTITRLYSIPVIVAATSNAPGAGSPAPAPAAPAAQ